MNGTASDVRVRKSGFSSVTQCASNNNPFIQPIYLKAELNSCFLDLSEYNFSQIDVIEVPQNIISNISEISSLLNP